MDNLVPELLQVFLTTRDVFVKELELVLKFDYFFLNNSCWVQNNSSIASYNFIP